MSASDVDKLCLVSRTKLKYIQENKRGFYRRVAMRTDATKKTELALEEIQNKATSLQRADTPLVEFLYRYLDN